VVPACLDDSQTGLPVLMTVRQGTRGCKMFYVYVIKSLKCNIYYVGLSSDPERRLKEHNKGDSKFTKGYRPWILVYKERFNDRSQARKREVYLKRTFNKKKIISGIK
jgi:putative endonuclease